MYNVIIILLIRWILICSNYFDMIARVIRIYKLRGQNVIFCQVNLQTITRANSILAAFIADLPPIIRVLITIISITILLRVRFHIVLRIRSPWKIISGSY
jgi:hypothetical protein